jgi:NADH dehydrogenase
VVFGATGFLGRRIVRHLLDHHFTVRAASRHPAPSTAVKDQGPAFAFLCADVNDDESVVDAAAGAFAVVNAVSLYSERGRQTFESMHVRAAARVARHSRQLGVRRLVHVSGIGANPASTSRYIASRGRGEAAVRNEFPAAVIIRPAVMFGIDDSFVTPLAGLMRALPVFPLFGSGRTQLQPCCVEDVAEGIVRALVVAEPARIYELAGPQIFTYQTLVRTIGEHFGFGGALVPVPFGLWHALAVITERLPYPPLARTQVELMELDNVASADCPGFPTLGINPRSLGEFLKRQ